jgi:hypothetical protein
MNRWSSQVATATVCVLWMSSTSAAASLVYLSAAGAGQGATPVAPQETLKFLPGGGSFHIWIQPDALFTGISLDVEITGDAIRFTDSTVHNPSIGSDFRWLAEMIRDGTVTPTRVSRIEGAGLAPLAGYGTGIGPSTSSSDPLYEPGGGFLFATIDFDVPQPASTATVSLAIGHNLWSDSFGVASGSVLLGVGDGPVAITSGATGTVVDMQFAARPLHPSDFNRDGEVGGEDLLIWQSGFGINSGATRSQGDANNDGKIGGEDFGLWELHYGTTPTPAAALAVTVPESPSFHLMLGAVGIALVTPGTGRSRGLFPLHFPSLG